MALGLLVRALGLSETAVWGSERQHGELETSLGSACGCLERGFQDQGTPGKKSTAACLIRSAACCVMLWHVHCKVVATQRYPVSRATDE